jgi:hypothetical protein
VFFSEEKMSLRLYSILENHPRIRNMAFMFALGLLCGALVSGDRLSQADTFSVMPHLSELKAEATCSGGALKPEMMPKDIDITGKCTVGAGTYVFNNVDIFGSTDGKTQASLAFADAPIDFWAKSILIENNGTLTAGVAPDGVTISPVGTNPGGRITIHLYGPQQTAKEAQGVMCHDKTCGVTKALFDSNMMKTLDPTTCVAASKNGGTLPNDDCFYMYDALFGDGGGNVKGFYGYKVLGIGYGGTLRLYGKKGATYPDTTVDPMNTGTSWVRLNNCAKGDSDPKCTDGVLQPGAATLTLSRAVDWKMGDDIIVTTTDYLTSHTEQLKLTADAVGNTITIASPGLQFPHHATAIDLTSRLPAGRKLTDLTSVDTRAAVALLSRNITIVSGGDTAMSDLPVPQIPPKADPKLYFGGHVIFRQGFKQLQVQGVEFKQLGQGGRIGHYPIHFHMSRQVPTDTFVKDSSVWDSMTRFIVLHATQGVLLARNVGYKSIGMGYYLEDGTETNNKLYANLGVSAIAAVNDAANTRLVPGILASNKDGAGKPYLPNSENTPYDSDYEHPTLFWFMNGWNDFEYNMAVGAEMCGNCYWMPPGANSGGSRFMNWKGYTSLQKNFDHHGTSPLQEFLGNTCSTAMMAFHINGNTSFCAGINTAYTIDQAKVQFNSIKNDLLPLPVGVKGNPAAPDPPNETFYPRVNSGGNRQATKCNSLTGDCSTSEKCASGHLENCMVTVLDKFTTSFNFAHQNFAAIWVRPQFNLVLNSAITDVLNGGLTFVTGGGYTRSDALPGIWDLARKSVFIGNTQSFAANPFGSNGGPVNAKGVQCGNVQPADDFCIPVDDTTKKDLGVSFNRGAAFAVNQRFFNIYDGPSLEDSNAFLDITATQLTDCTDGGDKTCYHSKWMQGKILGVPGVFLNNGQQPTACYLPNAAIAWKQPNGFYYPPSFHSTNLYFNNVDIHHYVIVPRFLGSTYTTDSSAATQRYCNRQSDMFTGFTDIDRQTELNDDDGSLTGLVSTVSVNEDQFFNAPTQDIECKSDVDTTNSMKIPQPATAITSPYDYVTTVVYPDCAKIPWGGPPPAPINAGACNDPDVKDSRVPWTWSYDCANERCYGVPLYRQLLNTGETAAPFIRMASQATGQRETMNPNNSIYYIDTTVDQATQTKSAINFNVFQANKKYHVFVLFAKTTTKEPLTMCKWNTTNSDCECNISADKNDPLGLFYLRDDCMQGNPDGTNPGTAFCKWATSDLDYPDAGAYGFSFTPGSSFATASTPEARAALRPAPACFPQTMANPMPPPATLPSPWNLPFNPASSDVATGCFYKNTPPSPKFCTTVGDTTSGDVTDSQ